MKVADFRFELPAVLIAQEPARERDLSRLMVLDRATGRIEHRIFRDLPSYLAEGDLLVLNDTRVIPARFVARKPSGGRIEVLLLERAGEGREGSSIAAGPDRGDRQEWRALVRGFGSEGESARFTFAAGLTAEVTGREGEGEIARVVLTADGDVTAALEAAGRPPTPPYIRREIDDARVDADRGRYQTVFAAASGAVAAPTAGLHFTTNLLDEIRARGVAIETLTLHVGWGTFMPVRAEDVEDHRVEPERYGIADRLARAFAAARERRGRVVAVGTTVTRALEFATGSDGALQAGSGRCDLFIHPGHPFRAVDALVTNFHLPESSLLMLAAAFAGREAILDAYREAVLREYRFYSYGDAMLIL
jgi:S-adenosylmethionine:tRNA ribosyltransferase-isomerase